MPCNGQIGTDRCKRKTEPQHKMTKGCEPFRVAISQHDSEGDKRKPETQGIDKPGAHDKSDTIEYHKPQGAVLRDDPLRNLTDSRTRVQCVKLYIQPPIESHCCAAGKDHTKNNKAK